MILARGGRACTLEGPGALSGAQPLGEFGSNSCQMRRKEPRRGVRSDSQSYDLSPGQGEMDALSSEQLALE